MNKLQRTQAILGLIASNLNATDKEIAEAFAAKHKPATSVKTVATTRKHLQEEMSGWSTVDLESFLQDCLADETFDDAAAANLATLALKTEVTAEEVTEIVDEWRERCEEVVGLPHWLIKEELCWQ